ncbi:hypothetical protein [Yaravirus sp. 'brasiliensis']|uniref:Uncharacterized protein n=1 Tax=Yaravirus sp. 'brasiliensis' TaxID=2739681 RepID=A0AAE7B7X9_9VIRU|nr:hypothetical protein QKS73_gp53 [Yaravirus brasiliensis]QKE44424.1 hypothetical protein [Yaravirus brasiliensis]
MSKGKWKGGDGFDVTGEGREQERADEKAREPLMNKPTNFSVGKGGDRVQNGESVTYPAVYGVDMAERKRQAILRDITYKGQTSSTGLPTRDLIGDRQVMLDQQTVDWLMREQDRMALINKDQYFEQSAIKSGLFSTPHGLDYLHKIKPDYFKRRRKLAKWVANAQLKLFDIRMNGIQNETDFNFLYMLQSLDESQKKILTKPVWLLNQLGSGAGEGQDVSNKPDWQSGIFTRPRVPNSNQVSSFAGMGSVNGTGITPKTQGTWSEWGWQSLFGGAMPTTGWPRG